MGFGLILVKKIIKTYNAQIWDYLKGSSLILIISKILYSN